MKIDSGDRLFGHPTVAIRDVLRRACHRPEPIMQIIHDRMSLSWVEAKTLFLALRDHGYLEGELSDLHLHPCYQDAPVPKRGEPPLRFLKRYMWNQTLTAGQLRQSSARPKITRKTAEKVLNEFKKRVEEVNRNPHFLMCVKKVVVFGSFLGDEDRVTDVDIAVEIHPKKQFRNNQTAMALLRVREAKQQGRRFSNYTQEMMWPFDEVVYFLRSRSKSISLHDIGNEEGLLRTTKTMILLDQEAECPNGETRWREREA